MHKPWYANFVCMLSLVLSTLACPALLMATSVNDPVMTAVQAMEQAAGASVAITLSSETGLISFLSTSPGLPIPVPPLEGNAHALLAGKGPDTPEGRALAFLDKYGPAFGIQELTQVVVTQVQAADEVGMDHVRLQQTVHDIPIVAGELTVHLHAAQVVAVLAKTLPASPSLDPVPKVTPDEAQRAAQAVLAKVYGVTDAKFNKPTLQFLNRGLLEGGSTPTRLTWFIKATKIDLQHFLWIGAHGEGVALHFPALAHTRNRTVYTAHNTSALPGMLVRSEGGPPTGDSDADAAYDFAGNTYDYYFTQHGRDSFDNAGGTMISTVHFCPSFRECPYANAYWSDEMQQMVYGEGFSAADDVVAHELTHAVTDYSANLLYRFQAGALNESMSDIFGELVDLTNSKGTDTTAVRWLIGEDIPGIGAFRNMMNPPEFGDPGKVRDPQFVCTSGPTHTDNGGVHSNSGVPNHAFALMVDGGTYNGQTITGIGLTKAGKIQYRTLTVYLTSGSNFLDDYLALQQACTDLVGTAGITAANCTEVKKALDAVEMFMTPCEQPQEPPLCATGQTVTTLFLDNLESGLGNWTPETPIGTNLWSLGNVYATSGVQHIAGDDHLGVTDSRLSLNQTFTLPAGARLQFNHSFEFEEGYDGGVIEYSTNGGASWTDAGALIAAGATYNETLTTCCSNPLGGRQAFSAPTSFGYTATQLNLASLAGQNVRFRFRIGTDPAVAAPGWFIDDVRLYQCGTPQNQAPVVNAGPDQTIILTAQAALHGIVTDDGLPNPPGAVTTTWSKFSGPGTVTFGNATARDTTASFSQTGTYVLRLTANDGALSAFDDVTITVQFQVPLTLTVTPTSVAAGGTVTATWAGIANPTPTDWLGLYVPNSADTAYLAWRYTSGTASGNVPFSIPGTLAQGTYELRLFRNDGFTRLVTSNSFMITVGPTTLTVSPTSVAAGGTVTATWAGIANPTPTDWLGLYVPNSADTAYLAWRYTSGTASGNVPFSIPGTVAPGTYELRLFRNDGFTRLVTSNSFTVTVGLTLTVTPPSVEVGGTATATWANIPSPTSFDWLGLYVPNGADTDYLAWRYTSGTASGNVPFTIPGTVAPGTYELRLFRNNSLTRLATSNHFTVTGGATLSVSPTSVAAGGTVTATWDRIVGPTSTDWLGLYRPGTSDIAYLAWRYTTGTASGNVPFVIFYPGTIVPGTYELRLLSHDSFTRLATSNPFTVTSPAGALVPDRVATDNQ